ncbi:MAG: Omp28-related outer membrane protein [Flavobacteriales bacterium]
MRNKPFLPVVLLALLGQGCDYVTSPVESPGGNPVGEGVIRRVLIEDFTGHLCNNCPGATQTALQLQAVYPEALIVVGIHVINFAAPQAPIGDGIYDTDFRTPAGNDYASQFGVSFLPTGMVSRKEFNSSVLQDDDAWSSDVSDILGEPADFDVWFSQLEHNATANTVTAEVKVAVINPVIGDHNLTIYLVEDHVTDWQLNSQATPPDVPDYDHRHVLRTNLNGSWGVPAVTGSAEAGDTLTFTYTDFPVNPDWNPANCALVGYVYNTASYEVMQVAERKFQP